MRVAVRALSPGINDPHTAISVLDRLGAALCDVAPLHLSTGVSLREGRLALVVPSVSYDGLTDTMFHSNPGSTVGGRILFRGWAGPVLSQWALVECAAPKRPDIADVLSPLDARRVGMLSSVPAAFER